MIPLRLSVKNFMCYRDDVPPLHFESIHVACLCGDNGHGKTALLDAITWALWGIARATPTGTGTINALRMSDLVHMGQTDMSVELDFTAGDQLYRVIRRHTVSIGGRNSRTTLELQIATDSGDEKFRSVSRNTVRETNARISEILNMDFKTFVNTAYLAQGQADLFTTSTPTERKRCLAEVLDLSYYQRLSEDANARSRRIHAEIQQALTAIDLHSEETARKPEYERNLANVKTRIAEAAPQVEAQRKQVETLRGEVQRLQALESEFGSLRQRLRLAEGDVFRLEGQVDTDTKRIVAYEVTIADAPRILTGYEALQSSQAELDRLNTALTEKSHLDSRHAALTQAIVRQEERITSTHKTLQHRISAELEPRVSRLPEIRKRQAALLQRHAILSEQVGVIEAQRNDADAIASRIQALERDNERLLEQMQDTRQKFDMLEQGEATCPLCNQALGEDGQQHLRAEYRRVGVESRKSYNENLAQIDALKGRHKAAATELAAMQAKHNSAGRALAADEANLARDERESLQAQEDLEKASMALADAEQALRAKTFAQDERREVADLNRAIAALEYDAEAHQQVRRQVSELRHFEAERHALNEAQTNLPGLSEALQTGCQMLTERQEEVSASKERMNELNKDLESLPSLTTTLSTAVAHSERLESELRQAEIERGILENNISRCERLETEISTLEQERNRLARDKSIYDELTIAFGKNGIQGARYRERHSPVAGRRQRDSCARHREPHASEA